MRRRRSTSCGSLAPGAARRAVAAGVFVHRLEDRQLELLGADRPRGAAVELLQQRDGALGVALRALDAERLVAALDLDVERRRDRAQVLVEAAGQVGEAGVVGRDEGVAKDHERRTGEWTARLSPQGGRRGAAIIAPMIGRLTGTLAAKTPPQVLVDVGGVGYEVDVPMSSFYNLPALGERVTLLTHFVVREDAQVLFGFLSHEERSTFRLLVKISGVGPRTALSILSGLSVDELARAVALQESARLVKVPGIGKKTAERLLLELKGKLGDAVAAPASVTSSAQADILQALVALGYSDREASATLKTLPADVEVAAGIKLALRALAK